MPPQKPLQPFVASLFFIRMVSLLEFGLERYIERESLAVPKEYRGRLIDKIDLLAAYGKLLASGELHRIRERRNQVAHELHVKTDWNEMETDLRLVHSELEHLGLVGPMPVFEFFAKREVEFPEDPDVVMIHRFNCGVKERDSNVLVMAWDVKFHSESGRQS